MIDFSSMSTCLGLFHAWKLKELHLLYVRIYIFVKSFLKVLFFLHAVLSNANNFQTDPFDLEIIL